MLKTHLCDLLGIEYPIIQAGMGIFTSAELVAAVSDAGSLGSLGAGSRTTDDLIRQIAGIRELTSGPFAINHVMSGFDEKAFSISLEAKPVLISFALGDPGELVKRVHDAGILVMHQATTVQQARQAAELGADIIVAQGGEAGGFGGTVSGLALIPQVVDAVAPIPVVAAGGIADGRGLAAALVLGAQGINMGTRFLASVEAPVGELWKQSIVSAESQDAVKVDVWNDIIPSRSGDYLNIPRALSSPFVEKWGNRRDDAKREAARLQAEVTGAIEHGRFGELLPFAGQTVGLIREILPAAEIVRRIVADAEEALKRESRLLV